MTRAGHALAGLAFALALFTAWVMSTGRAWAQDGMHGHAEHHDQYKSLVNPETGMSCCHNQDCRPGNVWRGADGKLHARLGSSTVAVPESALLPEKMSPHPPVGMICERYGTFYCVALSGAGG